MSICVRRWSMCALKEAPARGSKEGTGWANAGPRMDDREVGVRRRRRDAVWDKRWGRWHYTHSNWWMSAYREMVSLDARWPLTQPIRPYVKTTTSQFVLKLREREVVRQQRVCEGEETSLNNNHRDTSRLASTSSSVFLLTYIPFKMSLFSYKRSLFLQQGSKKHNINTTQRQLNVLVLYSQYRI